MVSMWRSKLGGEFKRELVESLENEHLTILRQLRLEPQNACCADCGRTNNTWASVNLGVFLCDRCADVHRALGTHVSKVKACSGSDLWGPDEITRMQELDLVFPNKQKFLEASSTNEPGKKELMDLCIKKYGMNAWGCENSLTHRKADSSAPTCTTSAWQTAKASLSPDQPSPVPPRPAKPSYIGDCHSLSLSKALDEFNFDDFFADMKSCSVDPKTAVSDIKSSKIQIEHLKSLHPTQTMKDEHDSEVHGLFKVYASTDPNSTVAPQLKRASTDEVWEGFEDW